MFENLRGGRQARNFTTNVPKILVLKSSSEQIFSKNLRWVPLKLADKQAIEDEPNIDGGIDVFSLVFKLGIILNE